MNRKARRLDAPEELAGWAHGPGAPVRATQQALQRIEVADAIILVEGISDQIAVETLAQRHGRDLDSEGVVVLPVGGAQAVAHYLERFGPHGEIRQLAGLCDADAADVVRRALRRAGFGSLSTTTEMAAVGFHVCHQDLEDELIRAAGPDLVMKTLDEQGEIRAFRTFQRQPEWRGRPVDSQLRRFLGSKARRSLRYARLLVEAIDVDSAPVPLESVLDDV